jgi:hypothetical protein
MDFDDLDDYMKMHVFEKDADNSSNPAFLWGSDKLAEAQAEIELSKALFKEAADYLDKGGNIQSHSMSHWGFREEGDK